MRCRKCFSTKDVRLGVNGVPYCANCMPVPSTEPCGVTPTRTVHECRPPVDNGRCGICFRPLTEAQVDPQSAREVIERRIQEHRAEQAEIRQWGERNYADGRSSDRHISLGEIVHELETVLSILDKPAELKPYQMPVSASDLGQEARYGKVS